MKNGTKYSIKVNFENEYGTIKFTEYFNITYKQRSCPLDIYVLSIYYQNVYIYKEYKYAESMYHYGESNFISFSVPKDIQNKVNILIDGKSYKYTIINEKPYYINSEDTEAYEVDISDLKTGNHTIIVSYSGDSKYLSNSINTTLEILKQRYVIEMNDATVQYPSQYNYKVRIVDNDGKGVSKEYVTFYIDNVKVKTTKTDANGYATLKLSKTPKTYKIKTVFKKINVIKKLTVKHVVSLKTANVKKSSKNLVLTATLAKVNRKYLKKKTVTFKFNGKIYKTKTNSKGIAKITIKKSVLSKLKVGKKITYQATYIKDTVKKTAKVKK